ncbi:unnamed protein product [Lota lota]
MRRETQRLDEEASDTRVVVLVEEEEYCGSAQIQVSTASPRVLGPGRRVCLFAGFMKARREKQSLIYDSTSDGTRQGLESMRGGVCATQGMKVVLKVGQSPYGLPPKTKPEQAAGRPTNRNTGNSTVNRGGGGGSEGPLPPSNVALIAGAASGSAFLLLVTAVICVVCYRRRHAKHSDTHHPPLSLSSLTSPKRGGMGGGGMGGMGSSNNNGSEPSDIIIPLRASDSAYCPHYEKVSGDYGHPVYIVQEMPPQSPANIYYKV